MPGVVSRLKRTRSIGTSNAVDARPRPCSTDALDDHLAMDETRDRSATHAHRGRTHARDHLTSRRGRAGRHRRCRTHHSGRGFISSLQRIAIRLDHLIARECSQKQGARVGTAIQCEQQQFYVVSFVRIVFTHAIKNYIAICMEKIVCR